MKVCHMLSLDVFVIVMQLHGTTQYAETVSNWLVVNDACFS